MPTIIIAVLTAITGPLLSYILKALGIFIVSYVGFSVGIESLEYYIQESFDGLPSVMIDLLNLAGLDSAIKMILSTLTAVAAYKSWARSTGTVWKKPGSPNVFDA